MNELKLERRTLVVDVYGKKESMIFPSVKKQKAYLNELLKEGADESTLTTAYFVDLGMDKKAADELELPDMYQILEIISGQKKI